jgi:putative transposase
MPESLEALDLLLLTVATPRKVHRDGIRCHGLRYLDRVRLVWSEAPTRVTTSA